MRFVLIITSALAINALNTIAHAEQKIPTLDNIAGAVKSSDDFLARKDVFIAAATNLIKDFSCTEKHLVDNGGFIRSTKAEKRYFTYCGDYDRIDLIIHDDVSYTLQKKNGPKKKYEFTGKNTLQSGEIAARIEELEARVRPIPASDFSANLDIYRQLLALDSTNERYKVKVSHYEAMDKANEQRIASSVSPAVTIENPACKDKISDWLTHNIAKKTFKKSLKSPRSAKFANYQTQFARYEANRCVYVVNVTVDAQNSFGAMIRNKISVAVSISLETLEGVGAVFE